MLQFGGAIELDIGILPEFVKIAPLFRKQGVPAGSPRRHEGRSDLIAHRRQAAIVRPTVRHELDEPKPLSRHEDIGCNHAGGVRHRLARDMQLRRAADDVIHRCRHAEAALSRFVNQQALPVADLVFFGKEWRSDDCGCTRIPGKRHQLLVGYQFGLHDNVGGSV